MKSSTLRLKLRGKRDVLRARQRTRQIARLLGYEFLEQSWIAACVFEMTQNAVRQGHRARLVIHLRGNQLIIALSLSKSQVQKSLGDGSPPTRALPHSWGEGREGGGTGSEKGAVSGGQPLAFPLPNKPSTLDRNDLPWIIEELNRLTPLFLFEEFRQHNLEILHLSSLLGCRLDRGEKDSSAA